MNTSSFLAKVKIIPSGCWDYMGTKGNNGYGCLWHDGHSTFAHRFAYQLFVGPIPEGLEIDHLCRNRKCVNPDHLETVTKKENLLRGIGFGAINARKTHCPNGHAYDTSNTRYDYRGYRYCRACSRQEKLKHLGGVK